MLVGNELKKSVRLKPWKMTLIWFPSPVKVAGVLPPIDHTILAFFDCRTGCAIIQRVSIVTHPSAIRVVTRSITNIVLVLVCQDCRRRKRSGSRRRRRRRKLS
ncbi:hypothetical protein V8G54_017516 [Vigna mungo]|uniref:Uncharacterized protein n=1 Tax=Vigna mungo TaxID=3915 RepID=A0AAQ3NN42_VIGMU